ncbi:MAG: Fe-S protein assembly co-chaperone HscB [Acidobacteria bacterium]|nr:Fe-S protein assembly co-chaperone HscB [Acidobacteriota bacterium]
MSHEACWQCGQPAAASLFCRYCNTLQRPSPDYFEFLGIERRLSLDPKALEQRFYQLSRLLHPDRYVRRSATERQYSLEATAILNDAYRVLRDPVRRAEYVLKENPAASTARLAAPPELLEEVFELNMALEELRSGDEEARPQLTGAHQRFLAMRSEADKALEVLFRESDQTHEAAVYDRMRLLLSRRRYIQNLVQEVEKELAP